MTDYTKLIERLCKIAKLEAANAGLDPSDAAEWEAADAIEALQAENERLKADYLEVERLCDATYVAKGADAYNHACDEMERFQDQRRKAGKEVGTERSLCDGMAWLYRHVSDTEAERDALQAKLDALAKQEPVGYLYGNSYWAETNPRITDNERLGTKLYAVPKALVPLTDERIHDLSVAFRGGADWSEEDFETAELFARAIEAAHGIGGTP